MLWYRERILAVIESMIASLQRNKEKINDLNVFPVPDGDTGTNMFATLSSGWNKINESIPKNLDLLEEFSKGALYGARGNSGVIVSQIIKGFEVGIKNNGNKLETPKDLKFVLAESKNYAYNSVSQPVEGTILSVIKAVSEEFDPKKFKDLKESFIEIEKIAKRATDTTPSQLEILRESGVVDSGAYGLMKMISGLSTAISGKPLKINVKEISDNGSQNQEFIKADPNKNIGYCTEFILTLKDTAKFSKENYQKKISKMGDSIVLIVSDDILKLHIHVKNPGEILNDAQKYGEFSKVKVENMTSQVLHGGHEVLGDKDLIIKIKESTYINEILSDEEENEIEKARKYYKDNLGIIVVSNGIGINREFKELNVDKIISGGQTMNPSVSTFVNAIKELEYENILILPNNSNIILTADIVKKTLKDQKNIFILPTKTIPQGLIALYNINKEMVDFENYKDIIVGEFQNISEGQITRATRNTDLYGVNVKKDEYIAIYNNKKIISSNKEMKKVFKSLLDIIIEKKDIEILNVFYNDNVDLEMVRETIKEYKKNYKDLEINYRYGGQTVYNFIIFGE